MVAVAANGDVQRVKRDVFNGKFVQQITQMFQRVDRRVNVRAANAEFSHVHLIIYDPMTFVDPSKRGIFLILLSNDYRKPLAQLRCET